MKCINCLDVAMATQPNSCPSGWKLVSPQSQEDWKTLNALGLLGVRSPSFVVDVTNPQNGCGGCGSPMNSNNPVQGMWATSDGSPWWLAGAGYEEPNGGYSANCYLGFFAYDSGLGFVPFDDALCNFHSTGRELLSWLAVCKPTTECA